MSWTCPAFIVALNIVLALATIFGNHISIDQFLFGSGRHGKSAPNSNGDSAYAPMVVRARSATARSQLNFYPNGTAPGSNLTIRLCDARGPDHARQVRVALSGRIRGLSVREGAEPGC